MLSYYFKKIIEKRGIKKKWIAKKLGIAESTLSTKFARNSFSLDDVMTLSNLLNLNAESIKAEYFHEKEIKERLGEIIDNCAIVYLCDNCNLVFKNTYCPNGCASNKLVLLGQTKDEAFEALQEHFKDNYSLDICNEKFSLKVVKKD